MKFSLILMFFLHVFSVAFSQSEIVGIVRTATGGEGLAGASVESALLGTSVTTDEGGRFRLLVQNESDTLVVSYLGYFSKRVPIVVNSTSIEILLEMRVSPLEEVVISTGYYTLPKERATGSFTHIDNDLLNRAAGYNILQRLEGIAPGVQFVNAGGTAASDIRIRGVSTIESDETPLIVLDNFPFEGDINSINPNDIESITVLRDAAAASIWGARAGNGVIVITTKQGGYKQRAQISFNSHYTRGQRPNLYYSKNWLPSTTVMEIEKSLFERGFYAENPRTPIPGYTEWLIKNREGLIDETELARQEADFRATDVRSEAMRFLYRGETHQQYAFNISGGGEWHRYYISAGSDFNKGVLMGDNNARLNLNLQNTFQPINKLEITAGIWYAQQRASSNGISLSNLNPSAGQKVSTYTRLADDQGNSLAIPYERRLAYYEDAANSGLLDWHFRPLDEQRLADKKSNSTEYRLNTDMRYRFFNYFNLSLTYQYLHSGATSENFYDAESYFVRNVVNRFTQADGSLVIPNGAILDGGRNVASQSQNGRAQLNYQREYGDEHILAALTGVDIREAKSESSPGYRIYGFSKEVLTGTATYNYSQSYSVRPSGSSRLPNPPTGLTRYIDRYLSYFGNVAYTYGRRYTLSSSLRWDGSNLFGVKTNQKGVPLWSIGASWNMGMEDFYGITEVLPHLRLRATFGSAGNVNKQVSVFPVVRFTANGITGLPVANVQSVGNPSLRWEKVSTLNLGVDLATKFNHLQLTADYYVKYAEDLIGVDFMAPSTGISNVARLTNRINYANLRTYGMDVQLTTQNISGALDWQTVFQLSYVRNKVTHFNTNEVNNISYYLSGTPPVRVGRSRDAIYALPWYGLDGGSGQPIVMVNGSKNADYMSYINSFTPDNLPVAGVIVPPLYGALRNTFSLGRLQFSANIKWNAGNVFRRMSMAPGAEYNGQGTLHHEDYFLRWKQPGDERHTDVPKGTLHVDNYQSTVYSYSNALITRGDQIRLQDINLSYGWSPSERIPFPVKKIRLYIYARNLGILWKANKKGIDPDYASADFVAPKVVAWGAQLNF